MTPRANLAAAPPPAAGAPAATPENLPAAVVPEPPPPEPAIQEPPVIMPVAPVPPVPEPVRMPAPIPAEGAALRARFGNPDFIRREMDTELWRYDSQRCAVFFFMQREGPMLQLRYTETLPRGMDMAADPVCLKTLEQRVESTPRGLMNPAVPQP